MTDIKYMCSCLCFLKSNIGSYIIIWIVKFVKYIKYVEYIKSLKKAKGNAATTLTALYRCIIIPCVFYMLFVET